MNANDRSIVALVMAGHGLVHTYELSIPIFMTAWLGELGVSEAVLGGVVGAGYFLFGALPLPFRTVHWSMPGKTVYCQLTRVT